MTPSTTRSCLFSVLSNAEKSINSFVKVPGVDMTRHRCCNFTNTVLATLSMATGRTNTELFQFFKMKKLDIPSKSAFTQQRQKLNSNFFPHILNEFNKATPFKKTYKNYHLYAIDGSDLNLPTDKKDTVYCVKQARSDNYYYQMHINALYDICENRYHSINIQPRPEMNEHVAFLKLVSEGDFPRNSIFIADRGYCSLNSIATLCANNKFFLIRAKTPGANVSFLKGLLKPDEPCDRIVSIGFTRNKKNNNKIACDTIKYLKKSQRFDIIDAEDYDTFHVIKVRCSCVKLPDNSYEYLISNLPMNEFSLLDLKELYWKRWSIETSFRSLKYALSLSFLHSVKRELIIQEIYAKIILYNFTSLIHAFAQNSKELLERNSRNKHKSNVSFDDAVPISKSLLVGKEKNCTIKTLLLRHLTSVRVGVPSGRHVRSQTVNALNNRV